MGKHDHKGRSTTPGRYVALSYAMLKTAAWRDLDAVARCAYVEIASRYRGPGSNNGAIPFSARQMAEALNVGKQTALRALEKLQSHGFLILTRKGAFSQKIRNASEWRLTEHKCDRTGALPSKEFERWPNSEHGSCSETERVST